jgi:hypothetical protein
VRDKLVNVDFNILTSTPEDYHQSLLSDITRFTRIAKEAGLRVK